MTTFLANLASRAIGPTAQSSSRLLRPLIPSIFASNSFDSNAARPANLDPDTTLPDIGSQPTATPPRGFKPMQAAAHTERNHQATVPSSVRARESETEGHPASTRPQSRPALTAEEHHFPSAQADPIVTGRDVISSSRHVAPQQIRTAAVSQETDVMDRLTLSQLTSTNQPAKPKKPSEISISVDGPTNKVATSQTLEDRSAVSPSAINRPQGAASSVPDALRVLPNKPISSSTPQPRSIINEQKAAPSSTMAARPAVDGNSHREASLGYIPTTVPTKSSTDFKQNVPSDLPALRDRSTSGIVAQNHPALFSALRAISPAKQNEPAAPQNVVEVHIGRIEVRASSQSSTKAAARENSKEPSLDDYLRGRTGRVRA